LRDEHVAPIERRAANPHADFARRGHGIGNVVDDELARSPEFVYPHRAHEDSLSANPLRSAFDRSAAGQALPHGSP
jgi:hypothetical protein